jgi:hypothetical protein
VNNQKKTSAEIAQKLTPLQYKVTQQDGTEPPFRNEYWDNKRHGIYVDVVSGEPLFSSLVTGGADRSPVEGGRQPSGARLRGWPCSDRSALLHELSCAEVHPGRSAGAGRIRPLFAAVPKRCPITGQSWRMGVGIGAVSSVTIRCWISSANSSTARSCNATS